MIDWINAGEQRPELYSTILVKYKAFSEGIALVKYGEDHGYGPGREVRNLEPVGFEGYEWDWSFDWKDVTHWCKIGL